MAVRRSCGALVGALLSLGGAALAEENSDLDLIPQALQNAPPPLERSEEREPASPQKLFVENAFTLPVRRSDLAVPQPSAVPTANWQNRTSLDGSGQWRLADNLTAALSNRFNLEEADDIDFPSHQAIRNDWREGYLTWEPLTRSYAEAGRINLRNGVALGFNPTDFFRARTQVDQASLDPSVIRQDRLGTVMVRGQRIWDQGSATLAFAPKLANPSALALTPEGGFDPHLDHTNSTDRFLLSLSRDMADLSPQVLVYHEADQTRFGLNLSRPIGQSVIAYAEWAGGRQPSEAAAALAYGKRTGTLPANAPAPWPVDTSQAFRNDLALGASWTSSAKVTINAEYHYHQAGLSRQDWDNWFAAGRQGNPLIDGELWYIRGFAADQQDPLTRSQAFFRIDWTDALVSHLELSAFAFVNLCDGSSLMQLAAGYDLSDRWSIGAYAAANLGPPLSERGSQAEAGSAILQVVRYF